MSVSGNIHGQTQAKGVSLKGLQFAAFSTRNLIFFLAVLAMNYTLMRPSPVDLLYITSFMLTLVYMTTQQKLAVTRQFVAFSLILGTWAVSYFLASVDNLGEQVGESNVTFELLAKTFAISIGIIGAFVSMSWTKRNFETFMKVYIVSCTIASILGTIGFLTQMELLTWDGRAKGLIDDPNMYGSFLIPAVVFCVYFLTRHKGGKLMLLGSMAIILFGILLSFSRIAVVAALFCILVYIFIQNRRSPNRLLAITGGLVFIGVILFVIASLSSAEFTEKLLDRLTFAKAYDLGEEGRYQRYLKVLPMIVQNPIGIGVLQLEKIFPEPIHNIWLSSFVNYGWGGGLSYLTLAFGSVVSTYLNYRRTKSEIPLVLFISLLGIIMCSSLHEGEHWRHSWLFYGLIWGFYASNFVSNKASAAKPARPSPQQMARTTAAPAA